MSRLVSEGLNLYRDCVVDPRRWSDRSVAGWAEDVAAGGSVDTQEAKHIRRIMRAATKLASFWASGTPADGSETWQARVDIAMGPRAWRPLLELAEYELSASGSPEDFEQVADLFPLVHNQPFMDGVAFEDWLDSRTPN